MRHQGATEHSQDYTAQKAVPLPMRFLWDGRTPTPVLLLLTKVDGLTSVIVENEFAATRTCVCSKILGGSGCPRTRKTALLVSCVRPYVLHRGSKADPLCSGLFQNFFAAKCQVLGRVLRSFAVLPLRGQITARWHRPCSSRVVLPRFGNSISSVTSSSHVASRFTVFAVP